MKSVFDILFAVIGLMVLFPFMLIIALLIILIDQMSPFFLQERIGLRKKKFTIFKFRTMKDDTVTRLGKILRSAGLDEIPQLINILCAQMSFVGPRPLTADDVVRLGWNDDFYACRWTVRPGITGFAQFSPTCHKKLSWALDRIYIQRRSIGLDVKIFLASFMVPVAGKERVKRWIYNRR